MSKNPISGRIQKYKNEVSQIVADFQAYQIPAITTPSEFGTVINELHKFRGKLTNHHKLLISEHEAWEKLIDQLSGDPVKQDTEQQRLDKELQDPDGIKHYYQLISQTLQQIDDHQTDIIANFQTILVPQIQQNLGQGTPLPGSSSLSSSSQALTGTTINPPVISSTQLANQSLPGSSIIPPGQFHLVQANTQLPVLTSSSCIPTTVTTTTVTQSTTSPPSILTNSIPSQPAGFFQHPYPKNNGIKLPELNIPKFSGDILKFQQFWETFSCVHDDHSLNDVRKLSYLISNLTGEALREVEGFRICGSNYVPVVNTLLEKYGNEDKVRKALYQKMEQVKTAGKSLEEIQSTVTAMETIIRQLYEMNMVVDEGMIKFNYENKLPLWFKERIYSNGEPTTLESFRTLVKSKLDILKSLHSPKQLAVNVNATYSNKEPDKESKISSKENNKQKLGKTPTCLFCSEKHYSNQCSNVSDISQRLKILKDNKRCLRCLGTGHFQQNCNNDKPCYFCKLDHHSVLCRTKNKEDVEASVNTICVYKPAKESMMPIRSAPIINPNGDNEHIAPVFIDCGASHSFIKTELAEKLNLRTLQNNKLQLKKFNESDDKLHPTTTDTYLVEFDIMCIDNSTIRIHAFTLDKLTSVLPAISEESGATLIEPEILIGNDYCWSFLPSTRRLDGYHTVESKIGDLVCGIPVNSASTTFNHNHDKIEEDITTFWNIESIDADSQYADEEQPTLRRFSNFIKMVVDRIIYNFTHVVEQLEGRIQTSINKRSNQQIKLTLLLLCILFFISFINVAVSEPVIMDLHCRNGMLDITSYNTSALLLKIDSKIRIIEDPKTTEQIKLPKSLSVGNVTATVTAYYNHMEVTNSTTCIGHGVCSNLHDFTESLVNLHCWKRYSWVITTFIIIGIIILLKYIYIKLSSSTKNISQPGGDDEETTELKEFKPHVPSIDYIRRTSKLVVLIVLTVLISTANACQNSIVISSTESECIQKANGFLQCSYNSKTMLNAMSGSENCLLLKNNKDIPMGAIRFTTKVSSTCLLTPIGSTRRANVSVFTSKRCPHMGSCDQSKCSNISPYESIEELKEYEKYVGFNTCFESCGSLQCGCFSIGVGCTFARIFAELEEEPINLYRCSEWLPEVNITVKVGSSPEKSFILHEQNSYEVDNIVFTLKSIQLKFMDNIQTNMLFASTNGTLSYIEDDTYTGLIKCTHDKCKLDPDACRCTPADSTVHCTCRSQQDLLHQLEDNQLPHMIGSHLITNRKNHPVYELGANLDLMIVTRNYTTSQIYQDPLSKAHAEEISGVIGRGAKFVLKCHTQFGSVTGHVHCNHQLFSIICNPDNYVNVLTYYSESSHINEVCNITCGSHTTTIPVHGTLEILDDDDSEWSDIHGKAIKTIDISTSIKSAFSFFYRNIIVICLILIIILVIVCLLKF